MMGERFFADGLGGAEPCVGVSRVSRLGMAAGGAAVGGVFCFFLFWYG